MLAEMGQQGVQYALQQILATNHIPGTAVCWLQRCQRSAVTNKRAAASRKYLAAESMYLGILQKLYSNRDHFFDTIVGIIVQAGNPRFNLRVWSLTAKASIAT